MLDLATDSSECLVQYYTMLVNLPECAFVSVKDNPRFYERQDVCYNLGVKEVTDSTQCTNVFGCSGVTSVKVPDSISTPTQW